MKQIIRAIGLAALPLLAMAQQTTGGSYNPVNIAWWIEAIIYGFFAAVIAIAILWHCAHGALGSHEGFSKIINVLIFGAIGFGVIFILTNMTTGLAPPVIH